MRTVLAIDTATHVAVGIARVTDENAPGEVLARAVEARSQQHVERLVPLVEQALAEAGLRYADVDQVVVGLGPGPFTGLRVGIVTGRVLASTLKVPLKGVCSLDPVAVASQAGGRFVATIDARRHELYWATYEPGTPVPRRVDGPAVTAPEDITAGLPVLGPGTATRPDLYGDVTPSGVDAGTMAAVAHLLPDEGTEPLYLRRPDATVSTRRKSALTPREPR